MAIKIIQKVTINCDKCNKKVAEIKLSEEALYCLEQNEKYTVVTCTDCLPKFQTKTL